MNLRNLFLTLLVAGSLATGAYAASPVVVTADNPKVNQNFNGVEHVAGAATASLPAGWAIDVNCDKTRTIRKWSDAVGEITSANTKGCFVGPNLASNEKNGPYFFYDSANPDDYAVGGITTGTGTAGGADCITLMGAFTNGADQPIDRINVSYAIEKYRNGNNDNGWEVSLHYSLDGINWTAAGNDFKNLYSKDSATAGAAVVPITTDKIENRTLMVDVASGQTLYLAWMMTVAAGTEGSGAQVFGIDDIDLSFGFADANVHNIYIENATRRSNLSIYSADNTDYYGAAPGQTSTITKNVNGVTYNVWTAVGTDAYDITATIGADAIGTARINPATDTYLCASPQGLVVIADPDSYTGWVDPTRPPFVASGIYLRGEVNSWNADSDWEFSNEGDNTYVLYDKTLKGQFKVADSGWSENCNYGSNGSNVMADEPYALVPKVDTNISCGNYTFACKRIVLTIVDGVATLLLEGDDNEAGLTSVYMVGDFNNWNYTGNVGELKLDEATGLYSGRASLTAGANGLSNWMIYLRPGRIGAYGATTAATEATTQGTLVKGATATVAAAPATYDVTFDLSTGNYTLTKVESEPSTLVLDPAYTVLVPTNPEKIKVLSLNNSLIHYNDQARMFNEIATAMGKDAVWTKHTNLGKTLQYHWEEGDGVIADGTPGAKMVVRSDAWSHIILQEQTALPRTDLESFRKSVKQWVDYIRQYCPNPNAVIILPMNWHYAQDWSNFNENNRILMENYAAVARELGVVVCPVAVAYQAKFDADGGPVTEAEWFLPGDDRHPTIRATYMAACMEYGLIFNEDPTTITYYPTYTTDYDNKAIDSAIAADMRTFAANALESYTNTVDHHDGVVRFEAGVYDDFGIKVDELPVSYSVDGGGTISADGIFTSDGTLGTFTVTATAGTFSTKAQINVVEAETEVVTYPAIILNQYNLTAAENFDSMGNSATATLPEAWRIDKQTVSPRTVGTYGLAVTQTENTGGVNLPSNAKNGIWNFGADDDSDRAVGGITTGVDNGTRAVNVYTHLYNDGKKNIESLNLTYNVEKYRKGNNTAGFTVQLYYSLTGQNWTSAGDAFRTDFDADNVTEGYASVPGETRTVSGKLPVGLAPGVDLYLAWNISVTSGTAAQGAPALAIDDVEFVGALPEIPVKKHYIYVDNQTSWEGLGLYAWGESELFGSWPGQAPFDEKVINGTTFQVFGHDADQGSYNLIFNNWNNGKQLADYNITDHTQDHYFRITDDKVVKLDIASSIDVPGVESDLRLDVNGRSVSSTADAAMSVYNLQGERVAKGHGRVLDLTTLAAGIYIVNAKTDSDTATVKVNLK